MMVIEKRNSSKTWIYYENRFHTWYLRKHLRSLNVFFENQYHSREGILLRTLPSTLWSVICFQSLPLYINIMILMIWCSKYFLLWSSLSAAVISQFNGIVMIFLFLFLLFYILLCILLLPSNFLNLVLCWLEKNMCVCMRLCMCVV